MARRSPLNPQSDDREFSAGADEARAELAAGLLRGQARISPKYFYSTLGSKLFEAICQLDEYYLTRVEAEIFATHGGEIGAVAGAGAALIDLGAGNCEKAASLFGVLRPQQYVPVDISVEFLRGAVKKLQWEYPAVAMHPLGMDFAENFALPAGIGRGSQKLFFYPGSSIGNFTPLQAAQFLRRLRAAGGDECGILIGVDLVKDAAVLEAAYDDALGVTAAFNLNALGHANWLMGSDFSLRAWRHVALFNAEQSRIEMHLEAKQAQVVRWPGGERHFAAGERIHTENSYKYTRRAFLELLESSGFGHATCWTDECQKYLVCHARAV